MNKSEKPDGRRLRSQRSRQEISAALMRLIEGGNYMPRAVELAEETGLSLRTIFRHIEDMESLFRDLTKQINSEVLPILMRPYRSQHWRLQLEEAMQNRIEVYEKVLPYKLAADLRRFRSPALMENYRYGIELERAQLKGVMPPEIQSDEVLFNSLQIVTGFQSWRRLRHDQGLSPEAASEVVSRIVAGLLPVKGTENCLPTE